MNAILPRMMIAHDVLQALRHLKKVDPIMKDLIEKHGILPMPRLPNTFEMLARIIIGQQLSGKAADTIFGRVKLAVGGRMNAKSLGACSDARLRAAGVSRPKVNALRSLVEHVESRKLRIAKLAECCDDDVAAAITQVKGMGPWSAQMYLMFVLARPDVFPDRDLGIRKTLTQLYRIRLTPNSIERVSKPWRPYRTVASLYLWKSLDNRP